jgi:hypothetical protein
MLNFFSSSADSLTACSTSTHGIMICPVFRTITSTSRLSPISRGVVSMLHCTVMFAIHSFARYRESAKTPSSTYPAYAISPACRMKETTSMTAIAMNQRIQR